MKTVRLVRSTQVKRCFATAMAVEPDMNLNHEAGQQRRPSHGHDTHAIPPQQMYDVYRKYQKMNDHDVERDAEIIDFSRGLSAEQARKLKVVQSIPAATATSTFRAFLSDQRQPDVVSGPCTVYEHVEFPGLKLFPNLLPPEVQVAFVDRLLHRDLSNPLHKTNLHDDYILPYVRDAACEDSPPSASLFSLGPSSLLLPRVSGCKNQPLSLAQFLNRRWRYLTLGTQYDWATRLYPSKDQVMTGFPSDVADLVSGLFPQVQAESGVVLIYSPKDFMPVHRDVSEMCQRDLCSFSLGCDGLFVIALDDQLARSNPSGLNTGNAEDENHDRPLRTITIRVRSGDMIQMSGLARWAWHAMPKVMAGTCPEFLHQWPVGSPTQSEERTKSYENWRGYMTRKRINISCRQVYA